ncbi:MAG: DUF192 domain-containing protein [Candidatus Aenigmarchaeota archaeon]|nr:DUF192 domain-containing protein [Candidatus Aenigmarchaeota archaeon]
MITITKNSRKVFEAEEADNLIKKIAGLSFRGRLPKNCAMLFSFPVEHRWSFWMFGMRFPIDIMFLDRKGRVVHIEKNAKPFSLDPSTWKTLKPEKKFMHAVEINAGEAKNKRIKVGDALTFTSRS